MPISFFNTGVTVGTYAERLALSRSSTHLGQLFYQTDTDEYLKYVSYGGTNRWMQAELKPGRNSLINGSLPIWQRGTSISVSGPEYTADRWHCTNFGQAGTFTVSRQTSSVPTGFQQCLRATANSGTTTNSFLAQSLETSTVIPMAGKYVTASFWYRTPVNHSSNWTAWVYYSSATDGNLQIPASASSAVNVTLSNSATWSYQTMTGLLPAGATSLALRFDNANNNVSGAQFEVTGLQLEVGTAPSEFEVESVSETLQRCYRYAQLVYGAQVFFLGQTGYRGGSRSHVQWLAPMRTAPSAVTTYASGTTISTLAVFAAVDGDGNVNDAASIGSPSLTLSNIHGATLALGSIPSMLTDRPYTLGKGPGFLASAEL